jgi:hypothetical protein
METESLKEITGPEVGLTGVKLATVTLDEQAPAVADISEEFSQVDEEPSARTGGSAQRLALHLQQR